MHLAEKLKQVILLVPGHCHRNRRGANKKQSRLPNRSCVLWASCLAAILGCLLIIFGAGCKSVGPGTVRRDRLHYSAALSDSWKEQLLVNIVKTRYGDSPAFLEVVSVVSGYTVEMGIGAMGQYSPPSMRGDTFVGGAISGKYTDRPTISYAPMAGEKFARGLMSPVPLDAVWSVVEGGVPADFLLGLTLQSMEGHQNLGLYAGEFKPMDPNFARTVQLLRSLQDTNAFDIDIIKKPDELQIWMRLPQTGDFPTSVAEQVSELKKLLNIAAETNRVRIEFGTRAFEPGVVGVRTRSLMQILGSLGAGVELPPEREAMGGFVKVDPACRPPGFRVHSGKDKPQQAFVAVPYEGDWYWIDRQDLASRKALAALTLLLNFLESGDSKAAPVLTIPTN